MLTPQADPHISRCPESTASTHALAPGTRPASSLGSQGASLLSGEAAKPSRLHLHHSQQGERQKQEELRPEEGNVSRPSPWLRVSPETF